MLFRMLQGAVLFQYPFNVTAYYALILRSLTVLEGLALYTDPNFKVCKYSSSPITIPMATIRQDY